MPPHPPTDYGPDRRCAECGCKVNRYTKPQPLTGYVFCNAHWEYPDGFRPGPTERLVKECA